MQRIPDLDEAPPAEALPSLALESRHELPTRPGIYVFFGQRDMPLYIGKSVNIRARVRSHVSQPASMRHQRLMEQTCLVAWRETGGDLGAQLLEADLIKRWIPLHNRQLRKRVRLVSWNWPAGDSHPTLTDGQWIVTGRSCFYGLYRNHREASTVLRDIAGEAALCLRVLGLDSGRGACFGYQIGRCRGACCGKETLEAHTLRAREAMERLRIEQWPWPGRVAFRESDTPGHSCFHIVDHWHYQGTVASLQALESLPDARGFDIDTYRIINRFLASPHATIETISIDGDITDDPHDI
ncbi:hypothetical protein [Salinicola avicenniae]|uniref:hypothetical protein n=1 Tax=Salinicola avicenniae TaxID=2916836 RepID=UPI0020744D8F|nr:MULTISPECIES: hypothetical protein [unclassified Salinicola]